MPHTNRHGLLMGSLLAAGLGLGLASCRPAVTSELSVSLSTNPSPARVGPTDLNLSLERAGKPLTGAQVEVEGNMTHAGMAPMRAAARELGGGRYTVRGFELGMAGDWVLTVRARTDRAELSADAPLEVRTP